MTSSFYATKSDEALGSWQPGYDLNNSFKEITEMLNSLHQECEKELERLRSVVLRQQYEMKRVGLDVPEELSFHSIKLPSKRSSTRCSTRECQGAAAALQASHKLGSDNDDKSHKGGEETLPDKVLVPKGGVIDRDVGEVDIAEIAGQLDAEEANEAEEDADEIPEQIFELKSEWSKVPVATGRMPDPDSSVVNSYVRNMLDVTKEETIISDGVLHRSLMRRSVTSIARFIPKGCIVNPASRFRMLWDVTGMILISYDMIAIPIHLAFNPDPVWFTTGMGWITLFFWTLDMVSSLFTGYYKNGELVMDQHSIIGNYFKGWFWVDCVVVIPDWVMKFLMQGSAAGGAAGLGRVLRVARIMRVLRLLRLLKLKRLFTIVYDIIDSEVMFIVFNLARLLTVILFMNHIVACAWYGVGRLSKMNGAPRNWLEDTGMTRVWGSSLEWKYLTSLHWSITQFTPASMDVSATNVAERLFSIVILFWALVALSSIIGSVSASMTALRNMSADENKQMWILRRYFKQERITPDLTARVLRYLEFQQMEHHNRIETGSVKLLKCLSDSFSAELQHEMHAPYLKDHPLFNYITNDSNMKNVMYRTCYVALKATPSAQEETLFTAGDEGMHVFFVKRGRYEYLMVDGRKLEILLGPKLWAAEAVLWTNWRHRGWMKATKISEALAVVPKKFAEVFSLHPKTWYLAMNYGIEFINYMNHLPGSALTDVMFDNDVWTYKVQASDRYDFFPARTSTTANTAMSTFQLASGGSKMNDAEKIEPPQLQEPACA